MVFIACDAGPAKSASSELIKIQMPIVHYLNIKNFIGDHECSNMPLSLLTEKGNIMIADDAMVLTLK